ncbi:penicillin acylase family protein [Pseudoalteromonas luteoviolacea]|uniref:penicillin acylase family protein n=1 Tax=Pseudoalteromonas luteoviolacea TaxID=43657 RepID=UPI001154F121|nr:penicillin acylase family protein [Pseudoalteromonas luteoviolacea]TQF71319.1 penicillin acylase family protein [Pseudoalteromonas luteoviolacea]
MFKSSPLLKRFIVFLIIPLITVLMYVWNYLQTSAENFSGDIVLSGIHQEVQIQRDAHSVPSIIAKSDHDVYFAMGFLHAQDRLWQLETQRRFAKGRLSEVFGRTALESDIWVRTLGLYKSAEESWDSLSTEAQDSLIAYSHGVNAFLDKNTNLPPEFLMFGFKPEKWEPIDSLVQIKVFALNLSDSMWHEIEYMAASQVLNTAQVNMLFGENGHSLYTSNANTINSLDKLLKIKHVLKDEMHIGGKYVGSNAWAVSGKLSANNKPILANDPHLNIQIPSLWYVVKQKSPKHEISGMSLVGLPLVVIGKNAHIAWGVTSMLADEQDLYIEQINPKQPSQYLFDGKWKEMVTREETINIKADFPAKLSRNIEPLKIKVRTTGNGPLISDAIEGAGNPLSLRWTALKSQDTSYDAFFKLGYAKNWKEFNDAMSLLVSPTLNMVYIDQDNIGYLAAGDIPIRGVGNGLYPLEGWHSKNHWQGVIPKTDMLSEFNPERGFIVSANNEIGGDDYDYYISSQWASPARAARIEELLQEQIDTKHKLTLEDMKMIQADTIDLSTINLLSFFRRIKGDNSNEDLALTHLNSWDGNMERDSTAAALFYVWSEQIRNLIFKDEFKGYWNLGNEISLANIENDKVFEALSNTELNWCDNILTNDLESCDSIVHEALKQAIKKLVKLQGNDISQWTWGNIHYTHYGHQPFSSVNFLDYIFERKIQNGGSENTVNVSSAVFKQGKGYEQYFGAGFRQILQLGGSEQATHLYMNSTGQSGNIASEHYDDMVEPFNKVQYFGLNNSSVKSSETLRMVPISSISTEEVK